MTTYTAHGTYCRECNRLARTAHAKAVETGYLYTATTYIDSSTHHVMSLDNGNNKRITGDEDHGRNYPL